MTFLNSLALAWLAAVLAAAAVALFRPVRRIANVSSLALWQEALDQTVGRTKRRRFFSASWLLVLAGSITAVLAAARPALLSGRPQRTIAIALYPSAELANPPGRDRLYEATGRILSRLASQDQVQVILPAGAGGASELLSIEQARQRIQAVAPTDVPASRLALPAVSDQAQAIYRFYPATLALPAQPKCVDVPLAVTTPAVTLDAVAAEELADGSQLLVAMKNHTDAAQAVRLICTVDGVDLPERNLTLSAGQRRAEIFSLPAGSRGVAAAVGGAVGQQAALRLVEFPAVKLAVIGRPDPMLRRFADAMPQATVAAGWADADVVLAVGGELPADKPGVLFDPSVAPAGWKLADEPAGPVNLAQADVLADSPLLADVDLSTVAVRRVRPLVPAALASGQRLASISAGVLVLATESPRRLYVAFDPAADNTNFALSPAFLPLLANAVDWLSPPEAGQSRQWVLEEGVVGLSSSPAPATTGESPLPDPQPARVSHELWPWLASAGAVLWLAGWWRRTRE